MNIPRPSQPQGNPAIINQQFLRGPSSFTIPIRHISISNDNDPKNHLPHHHHHHHPHYQFQQQQQQTLSSSLPQSAAAFPHPFAVGQGTGDARLPTQQSQQQQQQFVVNAFPANQQFLQQNPAASQNWQKAQQQQGTVDRFSTASSSSSSSAAGTPAGVESMSNPGLPHPQAPPNAAQHPIAAHPHHHHQHPQHVIPGGVQPAAPGPVQQSGPIPIPFASQPQSQNGSLPHTPHTPQTPQTPNSQPPLLPHPQHVMYGTVPHQMPSGPRMPGSHQAMSNHQVPMQYPNQFLSQPRAPFNSMPPTTMAQHMTAHHGHQPGNFMVPMIIQQPGQMPVWSAAPQYTVLAPQQAQAYAPRPPVQGHIAYSQANSHDNVQPNASMQPQQATAAPAMSQHQTLPQPQVMHAPLQQQQQQQQPQQPTSFSQIASAAAAAPYYAQTTPYAYMPTPAMGQISVAQAMPQGQPVQQQQQQQQQQIQQQQHAVVSSHAVVSTAAPAPVTTAAGAAGAPGGMHQPFPSVKFHHYPQATEKKASAAIAIIDPNTGIDIRSALVERKSSNVSESEKPDSASSTRGNTPGAPAAAVAAAATPSPGPQSSSVKSELQMKINAALHGGGSETSPTPVALTLSVTTTTTTTATASSPVSSAVVLTPSVVVSSIASAPAPAATVLPEAAQKNEEKKEESKVEKVTPQAPPSLMDLAPPPSVVEKQEVTKTEVEVVAAAVEVSANAETAAGDKPVSKSQQKKMKISEKAKLLEKKSDLDAFLPVEAEVPVAAAAAAAPVAAPVKEVEVPKSKEDSPVPAATSPPESSAAEVAAAQAVVKPPTPLMPPIEKEALPTPPPAVVTIPSLMEEVPVVDVVKEKSPEVVVPAPEPEKEPTPPPPSPPPVVEIPQVIKDPSPVAEVMPTSQVTPPPPPPAKEVEEEILDKNENKIEDSGYGDTEELESLVVADLTTSSTTPEKVDETAESAGDRLVKGLQSNANHNNNNSNNNGDSNEPATEELEEGEIVDDEPTDVSSKENTPVSNKSSSLEPSKSREQTPTSQSSDSPQPINYDTDQWSPSNPEGKKVYNRSFLLNLQYNSISMKKPETLPAINDVILDKPRPPTAQGATSPQGPAMMPSPHMQFDPFNPGFMKGGMGPMGGPPMVGPMGGFARPMMQGPGGSFRGDDRRRGPPDPRMMGPGGQMMGRNNSLKAQPKVISIGRSLGGDVKLNQADNAWKPSVKDKNKDADTAKTETLYKAVRGILNKLTPQKFSVLVKQVLELNIDSEERLKGCIDIIFEKAIDEPGFSVAYANMCKHLMLIKVTSKENKDKPDDKKSGDVYFRKLLLNRCQKEFEAGELLETDFGEEYEKILEIEDEKERTEAEEEHKIKTRKAKRRYLGNIRFIGELFKLKMLTEPIMHDCVCKLLRKKAEAKSDMHDEESLECLCRLLSTIGKDLDVDKSKVKMDSYFREIEKIVKQKKTATSRVRFLLMDVVELRKSLWIPRRDDNAPKTIDQIHKDAKREEEEMLAKLAEEKNKPRDTKSQGRNARSGTPGGGGPGGPGGRPGDDGWTMVNNLKSTKIDPAKMKLSKPTTIDDNNIQLGPGGRPGGWHRGSMGGSTAKAAAETPASGAPNRFGPLSGPEAGSASSAASAPSRPYDQRGGPGGNAGGGGRFTPQRDQSPWQSGAGGLGPRGGPGSMPPPGMKRPPMGGGPRDFRPDPFNPGFARSNSRPSSRPGSQPGSREGSRSRDMGDRSRGSSPFRASPTPMNQPSRLSMESSKPAAPAKHELTETQINKKVKSFMEEFLSVKDFNEAIACVEEMGCGSKKAFMVESILLNVLERSSSARLQTGRLCSDLIQKGLVQPEAFVEGSISVLSNAEDFIVDIPCLWNYLGEIFGGLITSGAHFPLKHLAKLCDSLKSCPGFSGKFLAATLKCAATSLGKQTLATCWQEEAPSLEDLIGGSTAEVDAFLDNNDLRFLVAAVAAVAADASNSANIPSSSSAPSSSSSSSSRPPVDLNQFSQELEKRLRTDREDPDIQNWIEEKVGKDVVKQGDFIKALMTAAISVAVSGESTTAIYESEKLKKHFDMLQHFLKMDVNLEKQALFALQDFVHSLQHPPGILQNIFDTLYDGDIISEDAFRAWNDGTDGGVAKLSVVNFFKWLDEADEADDPAEDGGAK